MDVKPLIALDIDFELERVLDLAIGFKETFYLLTQVLESGYGIDVFYVYEIRKEHQCLLFELSGHNIPFDYVRPFPNGNFILAAKRDDLDDDDAPLPFAVVVTCEGILFRRFALGDGLSDIKITKDNKFWTSYCDIGVLGNWWPKAIPNSGLMLWDEERNHIMSYRGKDYKKANIFDCYAMTLDRMDNLWFYFIDSNLEGLLCCLSEDQVVYYDLDASTRMLAVDLPYIIVSDSHRSRPIINLFKIEGESLNLVGNLEVVDWETQVRLSFKQCQFYGNQVMLLSGKHVYTFSVEDCRCIVKTGGKYERL